MTSQNLRNNPKFEEWRDISEILEQLEKISHHTIKRIDFEDGCFIE